MVVVMVVAADGYYENCDRFDRKGYVYDEFDFITENECDLRTKMSNV